MASPNMSDLTIYTAEYVLPIDEAMSVYSPGAVAVSGDKIVKVGAVAEVLAEYAAQSPKIKHLGRRVIVPGFVNVHSHIPMVLMRGVGDGMEVTEWLEKLVFPLEAKLLSPEFVYDATLAGCAESLRNGYTTVLDMYYFVEAALKAADKIGIRGIFSSCIVGFPTLEHATPEAAIDATVASIHKWKSHPRVSTCLAPHSCYTVPPEILKTCKEKADETGTLFNIHIAESEQELKTVTEMYGKHPLQHLKDLGISGSNIVAAHCVVMEDEQVDLLEESGIFVATNPCSNMKLSSGTARVLDMRASGVSVGLGTDGPMTSDRMDPFHAMDMMSKMQKLSAGDPTVMNARECMRIATIEGAKVMNMSDKVGSLEAGKAADMVVVDYLRGQFAPVYDIYSHLVYVCNGSMVTDVMVDGKWVVAEQKLTTVSEEKIFERAAKWKPIVERIVEGVS